MNMQTARSVDNRELAGFKSNPMIDRSKVARCAKSALLVAAIFCAATLVGGLIKGIGSRQPMPWLHPWAPFAAIGALFAGVFAVFFLWNLIGAIRAQPVYDILEEETPPSELLRYPVYGFVAMEFYWLILNRTFVVFIAPDGLYGWKTNGPVSNADKTYFEPYQEMLQDPDFTRDLPAVRKLAALRGGFIYPKAEIVAVTSDERRQWGMGGIAHSGHVYLRLASGSTRKLILLGEVIPDNVRDRMIASLGTRVASMV